MTVQYFYSIKKMFNYNNQLTNQIINQLNKKLTNQPTILTNCMKHNPSWRGEISSTSQGNTPHFTEPEGSLTLYLALHDSTPRKFHLLPGNSVIQCFAASALSAGYGPGMSVHMITKSLLWISDSLTFNMILFSVSPVLWIRRITNDITHS